MNSSAQRASNTKQILNDIGLETCSIQKSENESCSFDASAIWALQKGHSSLLFFDERNIAVTHVLHFGQIDTFWFGTALISYELSNGRNERESGITISSAIFFDWGQILTDDFILKSKGGDTQHYAISQLSKTIIFSIQYIKIIWDDRQKLSEK